MRLILIYRPPPSKKNKFTVSQFLIEFSTLAESILICLYRPFVAGDLNFQLDLPCQADSSNKLYLNATAYNITNSFLRSHTRPSYEGL